MQTYACPSCGGALSYAGTAPTLVCSYCGSTVAVPDALRQPGLQLEAQQTATQTTRWFIIFLVLVFGVPTCLGLAGSVIALAAGLLVPLLTLVMAFFLGR